MNTIKLFMFLSLGLLSSLTVIGSEYANYEISGIESKSFVLKLESSEKYNMIIRIRNGKNQIMWSERVVKNSSLLKRINLQQLKSGNYYLEFSDVKVTRIQPMIVTEDWIIVDKNLLQEYYRPLITQDKDAVLLNMLTLNGDLSQVKIYDTHGEVLYEEVLPGVQATHRKYSIKDLPSGVYYFKVINHYISDEKSLRIVK